MHPLRVFVLLCCALFISSISTAQLVDQLIPIDQQISGEISSGYILITPVTLDDEGDYPSGLYVLDSIGNPVFFKPITNQAVGPYPSARISDFKVQPSGLLSYSTQLASGGMGMYLLDSTFTIVDSIRTANGFSTDAHDLIHWPDGSYHLVGYENRLLDLSHLTTTEGETGSTEANVLGNVLQRFDADKNLEFEWKSIDHYQMQDTYGHAFTQPGYLDHAHYNSLEIDDDGNYILSFRHLHEVTKIDAQTGEIIWQLGGKNNDFTFLGDTMPFSTQHDARRIASGHLTLFDNGLYNSTPIARGIEYELDETNFTATAVWQFREPHGLPSSFIGNTTRLPNGNTMINWGGTFPLPISTSFTEVDTDDNIVLALDIIPNRYISYRALKQQLPFFIPRPEISCNGTMATLTAPDGYNYYEWNTGATTQSITVADTGIYQVWVNQGIGFVSSEPYHVENLEVMCNLSATAEVDIPHVKLYPNPASNQLFLEYQNIESTGVQLFNSSGQLIEEWEMGTAGKLQVDIDHLPTGIYLVKSGHLTKKLLKF